MSQVAKIVVAVVAVLALGIAALYAQQRQGESFSRWHGQGGSMMFGWGAGRGPHHDWGQGRYGPEMMQPGFGMMGGHGHHHGFGMGAMAGEAALADLALSETQRKQILAIRDQMRKKNWSTMGAMHDEMATMRDAFWSGGARDRTAILTAHQRMFELRQQMLERALDGAEQIEKLLTPQQRERLQQRWGSAWVIGADE